MKRLKLLTPFYYVKKTGSDESVLQTFAAKVVNIKTPNFSEVMFIQTDKKNLAHIETITFVSPGVCSMFYEYEKDKWGQDKKLNWIDFSDVCSGLNKKYKILA